MQMNVVQMLGSAYNDGIHDASDRLLLWSSGLQGSFRG